MSETAAAQKGQPKVPDPFPPEKKIGFALVGLGKLAVEELIPAFKASRRCELRALVSGDHDKARAIAEDNGIDEAHIYSYETMGRLADDERVDAVYIATPNALHRRDCVAAARAGKHVLCEKPMATTVEDGEAMIRACEEAGRRLMIAYRVHYEPINTRIRRMLRERKYGRPHFVVFDTLTDVGGAPQYRLDRAMNGGGSLFDIGIYALNTTRWLLGEEPVEITARGHTDPDDDRFRNLDEAMIAFQMRFPSGCTANCTSSFGTERVNRYRVMCQKGWLGMEPATSYRGLKGEHGDDEARHELRIEPVNQFAAEMDHFARCIRENRETDTPGEEGLRDLRLMHKIYEAARTGAVVKV